MKQYIVEQTGLVQVEAGRSFVVEVPDHFSEDDIEQRLRAEPESLPDTEGLEWADGADRLWVGYDVEIEAMDICDPNTMGAPSLDGLRVITLDD